MSVRWQCAWCDGPIPARARRDAIICSKRCRQARQRLTAAVRDTSSRSTSAADPRDMSRPPAAAHDTSHRAGGTRRLAYADPPYPGNAVYYRDQPDYAGEVDHVELLSRLATYDGWAVSTSSRALPLVLSVAVAQGLDVRVGAWVRGPRPGAARHPRSAWEPVVYVPAARGRSVPSRPDPGVDVLTHGVAPLVTLPGRVIRTKPPQFVAWMFNLIGAQPTDTLDDLYPGSGIVGKAWQAFTSTRRAQQLTAAWAEAIPRIDPHACHP